MQRFVRFAGFVYQYAIRQSRILIAPVAIGLMTSTAAATGQPWPSRPAGLASTCPEALTLAPTDGRRYILVVGALAYSQAFLDVILFTSEGSYEVKLPSFKINRPSEWRAGSLRSQGVFVEAPVGETFLGASIASIGTSCGASHVIAGPVGVRVANPGSQEEARFLASVRNDAVPASEAIVPERVAGSKPPPCADPFVRALTRRAAEPDYPDIAREQGVVGSASIEVRLDAAGSVTGTEIFHSTGNPALDRSALQAATKTVFEPAIFDCRPDAGSFLLQVDFTNSNRR